MELIISILMLFIVMNCILKLSFWKLWQTVLFGVVCGILIIGTCQYAIMQSKTQIADYLHNPAAMQDMAVIITIESVVCFTYCVAVLRGWFGQQEKGWVKPLKWYPSLLLFPVLFYLQTELIFTFPGMDFLTLSYGFAIVTVLLIPLMSYSFRHLITEKELRLEVHFLVSLFVAILGLLTTVNGNVTYQAIKEPTNWKALVLSFGLFLGLVFIGAIWNKYKWVFRQKREQNKK